MAEIPTLTITVGSFHFLFRRLMQEQPTPFNNGRPVIPWLQAIHLISTLKLPVFLMHPGNSSSAGMYPKTCSWYPIATSLLIYTLYSMGLRSSATVKGASVLLLISSTVTPSAISIRVRPWAKSTSKTP